MLFAGYKKDAKTGSDYDRGLFDTAFYDFWSNFEGADKDFIEKHVTPLAPKDEEPEVKEAKETLDEMVVDLEHFATIEDKLLEILRFTAIAENEKVTKDDLLSCIEEIQAIATNA